MGFVSRSSRIWAVLGPTNTGKTHLAIERMLGHQTGMIGFPLRLLARENYDRVVALKGARAVALITGEEKIVPPNPSYFVCTVESMPLDRVVDFLAVDEIQLCGDAERGHAFTDRLLHARGIHETMFLGSDIVAPLLRRLVPEAEISSRPRFSVLRYAGAKKLTRLPPRSAVVAFAVSDVFALAETVRRRRGGTAVVLGALSPRARNAQVGLFQSGEVDYLVATDAIGMGLNMDLDHVAFARLVKFDGSAPRRLVSAEIAQIAGRAGRHMSDGTFGVTDEISELDPDIVEAVENHRFDPLTRLFWRNARLDYRSLGGLIGSLEARPKGHGLVAAPQADDHRALRALAQMPEIAGLARNPEALRLLWEVCQIPDFRKVMSDTHARLLAQIYRHLAGVSGRLPTDWVAEQVSRLERLDGDIDTLMMRIAHIRTWTYIAHRADWLAAAAHWQERARAIEDSLSDALHDRITQRFVDKRSAFLVRRLASSNALLASVSDQGEVKVEGHYVGSLNGFRFQPDLDASGEAARTLMAAAQRVLRGEIAARVHRLEAAGDDEFELAGGALRWRGGLVGRLTPGPNALEPRAEALGSDFFTGDARERVRRRLAAFTAAYLRHALAPLYRVRDAELSAPARGLAFQLAEALGSLVPEAVAPLLRGLTRADRKQLARLGLRFGVETIYCEPLLKPEVASLTGLLWSLARGVSTAPGPKGSAAPRDAAIPDDAYRAMGFRILGPRILRFERFERLAAATRRLARQGAFAATPELAALAGCGLGDLTAVLRALGYRAAIDKDGKATSFHVARHRPQPRGHGRERARGPIRHAADGPFAKLKELSVAR
ncbi:MAG TPA: helicase-related protein [Stellaceae bacterium]|nr:helicase-related protein [Stellaceae bacterium]